MNFQHPIQAETQSQATDSRDVARFVSDESGATTLEYGMLLAAIAFPSYFIIQATLGYLLDYYGMVTALNALPFP